jgi:hypothetical protein
MKMNQITNTDNKQHPAHAAVCGTTASSDLSSSVTVTVDAAAALLPAAVGISSLSDDLLQISRVCARVTRPYTYDATVMNMMPLIMFNISRMLDSVGC